MNKILKDCLEQATQEVDPDDREWVFSVVDQEAFARSIIEKCGKLLDELEFRMYDGSSYSDAVKHHFGMN